MPVSVGDTLYRAADSRTGGGPSFVVYRYQVVAVTPQGAWVRPVGSVAGFPRFTFGSKRWMSLTANRQFAHPTKEAAMVSYRARKSKQIRILRAQIEAAATRLIEAGGEVPPKSQIFRSIS